MARYFFAESDEPRYLMPFILMFVMAGVSIAFALLLKWIAHEQGTSSLIPGAWKTVRSLLAVEDETEVKRA